MVTFHFLPWISEVLSVWWKKWWMDLGCFRCQERSICQQGSTGSYLILLESPGFLPTNNIVQYFVRSGFFRSPTQPHSFFKSKIHGKKELFERAKWFDFQEIRFYQVRRGSPLVPLRWCGPTWCRASLNWMIPWAPMLSRWKWLLGVFLFGSQMTCSFVFPFWGKILQKRKQNTEKVCRVKTRGNKEDDDEAFPDWVDGRFFWTRSGSILNIVV